MKNKYVFWLIILLFTILPIVIDSVVSQDKHYPFIWSLLLIPSILIVSSYPDWKTVGGVGLFYTILEYIAELSQPTQLTLDESVALLWSSVVNWILLLIIGHLRIRNENLLQQVYSLTQMDSLTAIYNRRYVDSYMESNLPFIKRTGQSFVVAILDIDHFKKINDQYGHLCGDEALKHFVNVVKKSIRATDMFARIGGEEFFLAFIDTSLEDAITIVERIHKNVEFSSFIYEGQIIPFTVSSGLTKYKEESLERLIKQADKALYKAKETGRNKWVVG